MRELLVRLLVIGAVATVIIVVVGVLYELAGSP